MSTLSRERLVDLSWRLWKLCEEGRFSDADLINAALDELAQFAGDDAPDREARADGTPVATANICVDPSPVPLVTDLRWDANYLAATSVPNKGALLRISFRASQAADRIEALEQLLGEAVHVDEAFLAEAEVSERDDAIRELMADRPVDLASDDRLIPLPDGRVAVVAKDLRVGDVVEGVLVASVDLRPAESFDHIDVEMGSGQRLIYATGTGTLVLLDKAAES